MRILIIIFALIYASVPTFAAGDWKGRVTDEAGEPVAYANVVLLSEADSTMVTGVTTDEYGFYDLVTDESDGILVVAMLGYETRYLRSAEGAVIVLKEDAALLEGAVATGMMVKTRITGNSMITDIQGTVLGKSGTAHEILSKVPGMTAKGEDLEVLGKGEPVFYINGRKMLDKNELKQLHSEDIQSVEVITVPGAQYDATVSSVVRIKTVRYKGDGFGFDVKVGNNQDLIFGNSDPSLNVNLRYRIGNLDFFGSVNTWKWDQVNSCGDMVYAYFKTKNIVQDMQSLIHYQEDGLDNSLGFNWQIAPNHSVGARVIRRSRFNAGQDMITDSYMSQFITSTSDILEDYIRVSQDDTRTNLDREGNAYYSGKIGGLAIDLNVDFMTSRLDSENDITEIVNDSHTHEKEQDERSSSELVAAKLVLAYPVWKGRLEAGSEVSFVSRSNSTAISNLPFSGSDSRVKENNIAAFATYNANLDRWGMVSAGLRYEHVVFDYTDVLEPMNSMSRSQDEFFPILSWTRQFGPVQTSVAYAFKTIRPNYYYLSDRITYMNSFTLLQGDPKLRNEKVQEVSVNARWKWINLFAAYERRDHTISQLAFSYDDNGLMLMRRVNLPDPVRNLAVFLSANPTWGVYSPNWTLGGQKYWCSMEFDDPCEPSGKVRESSVKPIFFIDLNNAFRFRHSWQLEANMSITTKGEVVNFEMYSPSYNLGFVVQKCWLKNDALCLRVSVSDVFKRGTQDVGQSCGAISFVEKSVQSLHRLDVTLRYTFNAAKSKYKGIGAGKAEQERMKNN